MNICIITLQYPPMIRGGVGSAVHRIARNMANVGCNVHVIAPGFQSIEASIIPNSEEGVNVHRTFPALGNYYYENPTELKVIGDYVTALHQEIDFDVIHGVFLVPAGLVATLVAREIDRPLVLSIRGNDVETLRYSPFHLGNIRWMLERASFVTSVTSELLKKARQLANIRAAKAIPNGIDISLFDSRPLREIAQEQGWRYQLFVEKFLRTKSRGRLVVGTTGILRYKKGFPLLLEAFKDLLTIYPETHLLLLGDFIEQNDKKTTIEQIKTMGLKRKVTITGPIPHPHVLAWMREMDIFAFPSLYEGSPNALLEAMRCGLPVVASRISGVMELINDEENGLLVPAGSLEDLAKKLRMLVKDSSLRRRLGKSARKTVEDQFSPEQETTTWMDVYYNVLNIYHDNAQHKLESSF